MLALVTVPDPPRLITTYLVTSRPGPGKNLLAYYVGCLILNVFVLLVPLAVLYFVPTLGAFVRGLATPATGGGSTVQPIPLALGVLSLLIAARLATRIRARRKVLEPASADDDAVPDSKSSSGLSRLLTGKEGSSGPRSAIRRLIGRIYVAWKGGSAWISLLMGLSYSPLQAAAALAIILGSGASIAAQLSAAVMFVAVMLAVVEIILVGFLVAPVKTEAVLQSSHRWTQLHDLQFFAAISAVGGVFLVAAGLGAF